MILAIAVKGKEYLYRSDSAHYVSKASADFICNALNAAHYKIEDDQVWHIFERLDYTSSAWSYAERQKFTRYKNRIRELRR
jgi:hypothetical protein